MKVQFISETQPGFEVEGQGDRRLTAEELITYCARVSNPNNQTNFDTSEKLIRFLISKKHWSPFEMVDLTVEIVTSRAIAAQILRHRSFVFQEFSQRYAESSCDFEDQECRIKGSSNRQGSLTTEDQELMDWFETRLRFVQKIARDFYREAIKNNVAPEVARMCLPLGVQTRLYMKGSIRSWIHYLQARLDPSAQHEHRIVAVEIAKIFRDRYPSIAKAAEI